MALLIITRSFATLAILTFSLFWSGCSPKTTPAALGVSSNVASTDRLEEDILYNVNQYRTGKGLPALQMEAAISAEAEGHSKDMATGKTAFSHDGFAERVKSFSHKLGPVASSAENVAFGNLSARQVVDGWLKSPGHRKNIEGKYNLTGIGTAQRKDGVVFFTQIFARKGE